MSFGLRDLKKEVVQNNERHFKRYIVWGEDLFALEAYNLLQARYGKSEVAIIGMPSDKDWTLKPFGPSRVRSAGSLEIARHFFPEHSFELDENESHFYKEGSFRSFSSRSKPEELLWGEEFFIAPKVLGVDSLLPPFKPELQNEMTKVEIQAIERMQARDLIENAQWCLIASNGTRFECEHLFIAHNPASFLDLYSNKKELSDHMVAWCESHQTKSELGLRLVFSGDVVIEKGTLFIPLSYTHPWGHFIGEFIFDEKLNQTRAEFLHFLDKNETSEEDIGKKIRLFKRQLEKINPELSHKMQAEYVFLKERSACLKFDNKGLDQSVEKLENLNFISVDAPFENKMSPVNNFEDSVVNMAGELRAALVQKNL